MTSSVNVCGWFVVARGNDDDDDTDNNDDDQLFPPFSLFTLFFIFIFREIDPSQRANLLSLSLFYPPTLCMSAARHAAARRLGIEELLTSQLRHQGKLTGPWALCHVKKHERHEDECTKDNKWQIFLEQGYQNFLFF